MSRIGNKPISVPAGVEVSVADGNVVTVKGPKGTLTKTLSKEMIIKNEAAEVVVERPSEAKAHKALHGLTRTLIANMVEGVTNGYSKNLEIVGVGYRAQKQGNNLVMNLGFSHQVIVPEIDGIKIDVPQPNQIVVSGIDKQKVGQFASEIREKRPPEPYKGKGIRYEGEYIIRKEGKAGKGAAKA
ncbi:MAG: 50S ribosomal protein L6 [Ruminococcus sp.]|nr:50S ribosomal protein L6 [Ruminococcus sp.]